MTERERRLDRRQLLGLGDAALRALGGLTACDGDQDDENKKSDVVAPGQQLARRARAGRAPS